MYLIPREPVFKIEKELNTKFHQINDPVRAKITHIYPKAITNWRFHSDQLLRGKVSRTSILLQYNIEAIRLISQSPVGWRSKWLRIKCIVLTFNREDRLEENTREKCFQYILAYVPCEQPVTYSVIIENASSKLTCE